MKHLLYAALALLLGVGAANAQNFTKSLQGSQDPRGPVAGDSLSNYYFPNHINAFGNLGITPSGTCVGACGALTGTDNAGSIITSGTTLTVTFGQAFGAIPACVRCSECARGCRTDLHCGNYCYRRHRCGHGQDL